MALVAWRRLAFIALAGMVSSCGDALVDGSYRGKALHSATGQVLGDSEVVNARSPDVDVSAFWTIPSREPGGEDTLVEQPGTQLHAEYFRPFLMRFFDEPSPEMLRSIRSGSSARFGVAWLGAYRDSNGNGHKDEAEPFLGASVGRILIRAPVALSAADSPTGAALEAGWHVTSVPLACPAPDGTPPRPQEDPVADGDCGVPLGAFCNRDSDCGQGVCVHEFLTPWPGGACLIPEPPPFGCRQRGSVLFRGEGDPTKGFWLKACTTTADCGRGAPYQCDQQRRACVPSGDLLVELGDRGPRPTFCVPPADPGP